MAALKMSEADFQRQILDLAARYRWRVAHFRPAMTRKGWRTAVAADGAGFPDLVLVRDRIIFAELKADAGRLTAAQTVWIAELRSAGAEAYVWRPVNFDGIDATLRRRQGPFPIAGRITEIVS